MRTQNDINARYRTKSLEEIKAEIQNSRKSGLNLQREKTISNLGTTQPKRKENTAGAGATQPKREKTTSNIGATQPKREETKESNPLLTFIIVVLVLALLCIPVVGFIALALLITACICS